MNDIAGPFLWLAGITTRAISSVMSVCHEFGTLASIKYSDNSYLYAVN